MLKFSLFPSLLTMLAATSAPPPPSEPSAIEIILAQRAAIPVTAAAPFAGGVVFAHVDGSTTLVALDGGEAFVSIGDEVATPGIQAQSQAPAQVPVYTTKWKDAKGVEHSVSTPVTGSNVKKAVEMHKAHVEALQAVYPPAE